MPARRALTHLDSTGQARMVDVSKKAVTLREARATADVVVSETAFAAAAAGDLPKGDLLSTVRLAGVMAAKRTHELVPMCHPLRLTGIDVEAVLDPSLPGIRLAARVRCVERTGAEMEALTACAVAGLTAIDMIKAIDPWARVEALQVAAKKGGRSGARTRPSRA
ncbi:MAG TPA: cyclic pyranopterin monophosphate synthase MoaC [Candidatus Solibacter sp.]|nr:cyclic pyranopterin monophosphate synthase MoaC [Candidatus Solibacter sp.]